MVLCLAVFLMVCVDCDEAIMKAVIEWWAVFWIVGCTLMVFQDWGYWLCFDGWSRVEGFLIEYLRWGVAASFAFLPIPSSLTIPFFSITLFLKHLVVKMSSVNNTSYFTVPIEQAPFTEVGFLLFVSLCDWLEVPYRVLASSPGSLDSFRPQCLTYVYAMSAIVIADFADSYL